MLYKIVYFVLFAKNSNKWREKSHSSNVILHVTQSYSCNSP